MSEELNTYNAFAKLNVMTDAAVDTPVPQMMFGLCTTGSEHSWLGDRLVFAYTSGEYANRFSISEITRIPDATELPEDTKIGKINFELLGENNIYNGKDGNSNTMFIFARDNAVNRFDYDNSFIFSDGNKISEMSAHNINFIGSDNNLFEGMTQKYGSNVKSDNNTFYNSNDNTAISSIFHDNVLLNSNNNILSGRNFHYESSVHNTLINTKNSLLYKANDTISIGGEYNFISDNSAHVLAIGRGLTCTGNTTDKIIIGNFNANSTDENEMLIVGGGSVDENYLKELTSNTAYSIDTVVNKLQPTSDKVDRKNIFTVNKNGYITISDYKNTRVSARYGYDGISAWDDLGTITTINYQQLYDSINTTQYYNDVQEVLDSQLKTLTDYCDFVVPEGKNTTVTGSYTDVFINYTPSTDDDEDNTDSYLILDTEKYKTNTTLSITNCTDGTITIHWKLYVAGNTSTLTKKVDSMCSNEFLKINSDGVDGFTLVNG